MKKVFIIPITLILITLITIFTFLRSKDREPKEIYCILDAQICPDGSSVGRIPPNCEFAPCPDTNDTISSPESSTVLLYYYSPELDRDDSGNIKCSRDGLVAIEKQLPLSQTQLKDTLDLLLKGKENLTTDQVSQGLTTEYPLPGFSLIETSLKKDGTLVLKFTDSQNKTIGGSCRVGVLWFQIEATAKQFSGINTVEFQPEDLFQP